MSGLKKVLRSYKLSAVVCSLNPTTSGAATGAATGACRTGAGSGTLTSSTTTGSGWATG